jgi:hypothetical protein
MAALLAEIIHIKTRTSLSNSIFRDGEWAVLKSPFPKKPRKKPINANGNANNVWENFIRLR